MAGAGDAGIGLRTQNAMTTNPNRPSSTAAVREVFATGERMSDAVLVVRVQARHPEMHRGQIIPARIRLERRGEVELVGKDERGSQIWQGTPPERIEEAKAASERRRKSDADKLKGNRSPQELAQIAAALLENDEVNSILREQTERSRAMRRARARAQDAAAETEAERRERKRQLREAERQQSIYLDFLKVHDGLRDTIGVLFAIRSFMRDEIRRREHDDPTRIPAERWGEVQRNLHEVIHVSGALWHDLTAIFDVPPERCPLCGDRIARDPHALDEGYIDAHAEEEAVVDGLVVE